MKKNFVLIVYSFLFGFSVSAQLPQISGLSIIEEGDVKIDWENTPEVDSGSIWYRDQYSDTFSNLHSFTSNETSFIHFNAGANYKIIWYYVMNNIGSESFSSDTVSTMLLQTEALDEVRIFVSWNLPMDGIYLLKRKYQGEVDRVREIVNTTSLIDTIEYCINDYTYTMYNAIGQIVASETEPITDVIQPIAPHIDSVSVLNNQFVRLNWQRSVSEDCSGYRIYKKQEIGIGWDVLSEINHPDTLFFIDTSFAHVCDSERTYCVVAVDFCGNSSPINEAQQLHNLLSYPPTLDTCNKTIELSWSPFGMYDLTPQLGGYHIWYSQDGAPFQSDGIAPPNTVSYLFDHPERNSQYVFKIQAINNLQTSSASSCEHNILATLPKEPEFGFIRYASVNNSYIDLCFEIDTQASSPTYEILRSMNGEEGTFLSIKLVQPTGNDFICITDSVVDVKRYSYYYQLHTLDSCAHILEAPKTVQSILLHTETNTESQIELNWNEYNGYMNGTNKYVVFRSIDNQPFEQISETFETAYIDYDGDAENYTSTLFYRVAAVSNNQNPDTAWSNVSQYVLKSFTVFFPNAFRPNGSINNIFRPIFAGIEVDEYQLIIYNRWGEQIFSTTKPNEGWNGKTNRGTDCPEGTYIYQFLMSDQSGNRYHKTGFVVLLR